MPSKKRKYEARFPPARIKKIMQTDEEIGKVAAAVPIIISRSLEIFLQSLVETTAKYTNDRKAKTMTTAHLKHNIENEKKFDFLKDLVANIADVATQDEEDTSGEVVDKPKKQRKPRASVSERKKRKKGSSTEGEDSEAHSDTEEKPHALQAKQAKKTPKTPPVVTTTTTTTTVVVETADALETADSASSQPISHSIDHIMGNTSKPIVSSPLLNQSTDEDVSTSNTFNFLQTGTQSSENPVSNTSILPTNQTGLIPTIQAGMSVNMMTTNDDEDDDYDA